MCYTEHIHLLQVFTLKEHKPMKKILFTSGIVAVLTVAVVAGTTVADAASERYKFTARGTITAIDPTNKTIKVDVNKATPAKAAADMEGENKEFKVGDAKIYSYSNTTKKDKRVTLGTLQIGQEIGFKGAAKTDDTFDASFIRIHDRSFTVVGVLQAHDQTARTMTILLTSSSYKPTIYKHGTTINLSYPESATFYEKSIKTAVTFDTVDANAQKVQVKGAITGSNTWEVKTLVDHFK